MIRPRRASCAILIAVFSAGAVLAGRLVAAPDHPTPHHQPPATAATVQANDVASLLAQSITAEGDDMDTARALIDRARTLARSPRDHLDIDLRLQAHLRRRGDYRGGLALAEDALVRARKLGDSERAFKFLVATGHAQRLLTEYPAALAIYQEALKLTPEVHDAADEIARVWASLGLIQFHQDNNAAALQSLEHALSIARTLPRDTTLSWVLNGYGLILADQRDFEGARAAHQEAREIRHDVGDRIGEADSLLNLAEVDEFTGDIDAAILGLETALPTYLELDAKGNQTTARLTLARLHLERGELAAAADQLDAIAPVVTALGNKNQLARYYRCWAALSEARGDFQAALEQTRRAQTWQDEASGERTQRALNELRARYDLEHKNADIAALRHERDLNEADLRRTAAELSRTHTRYLAGVLVGFSLLGCFAFVQGARRRAEKRIHAEIREARYLADEANALKTRLLGIASHDLKAPLRSLALRAQKLGEAAFEPGTVQAHCQQIAREIQRMLRLVHDLLDVSALDPTNAPLKLQTIDCRELAARIVEDQLPRAESRDLQLHWESPPTPLLIEADTDRLHQAIFNLLDNALKFTPPGKSVWVKAAAKPHQVVIEIADEGPGFTAQDFALLFQPFQLLSTPPADQSAHSSGLGLYIARQIVARHGGRLSLDSQPAAGARFVITLPTADPTTREPSSLPQGESLAAR